MKTLLMRRWTRTLSDEPRVLVVVGLLVAVLGAATAIPAAAGRIDVAVNPWGPCKVADTQAGALTVYVFHRASAWEPGFTGSSFRLGTGGGFTGVLSSVAYPAPFLAIGDITQGVQVVYTECNNNELILVATLEFTVFGTSEACSFLEILPPLGEEGVIAVNCAFEVEPTTAGGTLFVNHESHCGSACELGTRETTWGAIKSLYR